MIKLVCLDVDNTLLAHYTYIPQENIDSIAQASEKGVKFTIVSGRISQSTKHYMDLIGQKGAISSLGGCILEDSSGKIVEEFIIEKPIAEKVIELSRKWGITILFYHHKNWYTDCHADKKWIKSELAATGVEGIILPDLSKLLEEFCPNKFLAIGENHQNLNSFKEELEDFAGCGALNLFLSTADFLEVLPPSANKGQAVKSLCKYYGLKKEEVMSVGDYDNDIAMLDSSGIAVAVANATDNLKKHATYITQADCEHGAVAEAIIRFVLNENIQRLKTN